MSNKCVVLVLDDVPMWQDNVRLLLKAEMRDDGSEVYEVFSAASLHDAREQLRKRVFDVAIIDINLEPSDSSNTEGLEFLDALELYYASDHTHAVMLSGQGTIRMAVDAVTGSPLVVDYLEKSPLDADRFRTMVSRAWRFAEAAREKHLQIRMRPISASEIEKFKVVRIAEALAPDLDPVVARRDVELLLENLLLETLPLAPEVNVAIQDENGDEQKVHLTCWSRKLGTALDAVITRRRSQANDRLTNTQPQRTEDPPTVKQWSVRYFDGVLYRKQELEFRQFLSLHSNQATQA